MSCFYADHTPKIEGREDVGNALKALHASLRTLFLIIFLDYGEVKRLIKKVGRKVTPKKGNEKERSKKRKRIVVMPFG